MLRQERKGVLRIRPEQFCTGPQAEPHSPSTIPAVALITSEDIDSAPPQPGHLNVHTRLP